MDCFSQLWIGGFEVINIDLIRSRMDALNLTTAALADICPVPKSTLERILSGSTTNPGVQTVADIAVALHLSMDEIMGIAAPAPTGQARSNAFSYPAELSGYYRATIRELRSWLARVSVVCIVLVIYNMFRWILDVSNPHIGWVRLEDAKVGGVLAFFLIVFAVALVALLVKIILPALQKHKDK